MLPAIDCLADALQRLKDAKRPVIIVGYGALEAMEHVLKLAHKLKAPVRPPSRRRAGRGRSSAGSRVLGRSGTRWPAGV